MLLLLNMPKKFYITTPIYYTNHPPHLGTAYTTVAADVLARYHRKLGEDVFFLTGTDEHGEHIAQSAEKLNQTPQKFVDQMSAKFKKAWEKLNIKYDYFIRTTDSKHQRGVTDFLTKLYKSGNIYQDEYRALYCPYCEDFIFQKDLVDGKCPVHHKEPQLVSETNYFFKLKDFLPQVRKLIETNKMVIEPAERRKEVLSLLQQDLGNLSISRQKVKWGIPLPFDQEQTVYVWVDALLNYLTAIETDKFWPAEIHLIAKDIVKFHAIFWPALLLAVGLQPPRKIFVHGFFTVDGQKMSKTIGNVVDPVYLAEEYGTDALRYFLLREISFGQDGDFSIKRFQERYNADLANGLGNLMARVLTLAEKNKTDEPSANQLAEEIKSAQEKYQKSMLAINFNGALESIWHLISVADEYVEKNKPWELSEKDSVKFAKIIDSLLFVLKEISSLLEPFMPETAAEMLKQIKEGKKKSLFPRLEK